MNKTVAVLQCTKYDADLIYGVIREAFELSGGTEVLDVSGQTVLLKPNVLSDSETSKAVTTHPEFLRAVIRLIKELGAAKIYVGDSPGFQKPGFKGKKCGLWDICAEEGAEWYDFTAATVVRKIPEGRAVNQFVLSDIVDKVDKIISLPKMKTHQLMYFTGAIKNQFGVLPGLTKSPYHMMFPGRAGFAKMLVDLHQTVNPDYAFMDGITAMEGPGPGNGYPRNVGLILASSNLLALDITACRIVGYDPDIIPVNREAIDRGLWIESTNDLTVKGCNLDDVRIPDFKKIKLTGSTSQLIEFLTPSFIRNIMSSMTPRPVFREKACIRCGECVKICPAKALELKETAGIQPKFKNMVNIDYSKCIRCFCCHEVCPADAIAVKKAPFSKGIIF